MVLVGPALASRAHEASGGHHRCHREGILAWFDSGIVNGLIEGINSLVQAAKPKARSYRNRRTSKAATYLIAGKLDLRLPT
jgi:transposase